MPEAAEPGRPSPGATDIVNLFRSRPWIGAVALLVLLGVGTAWSVAVADPPPQPLVLPMAAGAGAPDLGPTSGPALGTGTTEESRPGALAGSAGPVPGGASSDPGSGEPIAGAPSALVIHAAGAVVRPGVYPVGPGARVADAVAAAGGARPDADLDRLNLAAPLVDGQRVYVARRGEQVGPGSADPAGPGPLGSSGAGPPGSGETGTSSGPTPSPVDLNSATVESLDRLPGVGPATAGAILSYRSRVGRFRSVTELLEVPGIGPAKFAALRPLVKV
ncbi:MAG: ComEA family DNA-binding protein [Acidimicrobiales bacterium]